MCVWPIAQYLVPRGVTSELELLTSTMGWEDHCLASSRLWADLPARRVLLWDRPGEAILAAVSCSS